MGADACEIPADRTSGWKSPLAFFFVCAHCSLTLLTGALAVGVATLPPIFGVDPVHVLIPALILGGLSLWMWTGRRMRNRSVA